MRTNWLVMDDSKDSFRAPYRARLAAAGRHLPTTRLTTDELMATTRHNTHVDLERLTGIHERRVSVGEEDSYSLATAAARNCLEKAQLDGSSLDVVINCSITKLHDGLTQWLEPTMSIAVARAVGASHAMTFDVSNACAGMLTGVTILNNWIRQGIVERGLVVSGEYISPLGRNAARDGQPADGHVGGGTADAEDADGVPAADSDQAGTRAVDGQVLGDVQLAGQGDGPVQAVPEADRVGTGV